MIRTLYDWTLRLADTRHAMWALAVIAFVESSVFPIPPDVLIVPMILARPSRAWAIALVATLGSVLGALLGYWLGATLFDSVGQPVLEFYGQTGHFDSFRARYAEWGAWAVLVAGVTPFPFKVITILSGAAHLNLGVFLISAVIARALRFFIVALLLWRFGSPIRDFIERRLGLVFSAGLLLLLGGFLFVRFL